MTRMGERATVPREEEEETVAEAVACGGGGGGLFCGRRGE